MPKSFGRMLSLSLWIVWDLTYPNRFLPSAQNYRKRPWKQSNQMSSTTFVQLHHQRNHCISPTGLHRAFPLQYYSPMIGPRTMLSHSLVGAPEFAIRYNSTPVVRLLRPLGNFRMRMLQLTLDAKSFLDCYIADWVGRNPSSFWMIWTYSLWWNTEGDVTKLPKSFYLHDTVPIIALVWLGNNWGTKVQISSKLVLLIVPSH